MKKRLLTHMVMGGLLITVIVNGKGVQVMPQLDIADEPFDDDVLDACAIEVDEKPWIVQWVNRIGCQAVAGCIYCKRFTMNIVCRALRMLMGPKRLKKRIRK
jgi:hypothetical protein